MSTATLETPVLETKHTEASRTMQLVSFRLGNEEYAVEITKVREIILMGEITRVPQTPHYVQGVINLRSAVIPVIDLRARFGLPESEQTPESRIMVMNVGRKTIGIIVDAVSEVLRVAKDSIAPPPPTIVGIGREFLTGLVKLHDRLLILLDVDQVLDEDEVTALSTSAG